MTSSGQQRRKRAGSTCPSRLPGLLALVLMASCGSAPPPEPSDEVDAGPRCSQQGLLSFDPGSPVVRRILLPPAVQETSNSQQHVVERPCAEQEDDDQCAELAAQDARARYSDAEITTSVMFQRQLVRVRFKVAGQVTESVFADQAAALAHLRSLEADGQAIRLVSVTTVPDPESPRLAVARATVRGAVVRRAALRLELQLRPADGDSASALVRAQRQANRAAFAIHSWSPADDGSLRLELGCTMGPRGETGN
ncbi:MAG: hypothetical protein JRI68_08345 [Deltaproteobacteria bacterium]|nr:hypothetical protein [Deltaproteobacteria bacterium]